MKHAAPCATLVVFGALTAFGAASSQVGAGGAQTLAPQRCSPDGANLAPARAEELAALRRSVERGPLLAALAGGATPLCSASAEGSKLQLDYRFAEGSSVSVVRDSSIEYTDISARLATSPAAGQPVSIADAVKLLARTERAAFALQGCGIDWQRADEAETNAVPPSRIRIYRGGTCNCLGRIGEDADGRVVSLGLRSAC